MTSPTARSLALLRKEGWTAQVVERFNQFAMVRVDLFHGIDVIAIKPDESGCFGVQATSGSNTTARVKKLIKIPELKVWVDAGNRLEVWSWK
ncbi:MAG: hypothetical protein AAB922_07330, partial [Patescibacteria group bacterium]